VGTPVLEFDYEYSNTEFVDSQIYSFTDTEKDYREISTQLQFWTGGVPGVPRTNFIQLAVSAWDRLANVAIPPTSITMWGGAERCDSSGNVYLSGADNTWYTCTPEADHAVYSNYTFGVTPSIAYLAISRGGSDITGQTNTVIVGEQIALTCLFVDAATNASSIAPITNFQWTVPGSYLSNYLVTNWMVTNLYLSGGGITNCCVTNAMATNSFLMSSSAVISTVIMTNSGVTFYWYDGSGSSTFEVQCTAIAKGVTMTAKTKFNVIRPSVDWIAVITGPVGINPDLIVESDHHGPVLQFGTNYPTPPGITFVLTNVNLNGWASGSWDFLSAQIGNTTSTSYQTNGTNVVGVGAGLDAQYPDSTFHLGVNEVDSDSPAEPLPSTLRKAFRADSFSTYLLFKPEGGMAVPMRRFDWNWSGIATNSTSSWTLVPGSESSTISANNVDTTSYPLWTNLLQNLSYSITNTP
jgi:hypothetical protein